MLEHWLYSLEQRHLADLTFSEVARALRALSTTYVERRERLSRKSAFDSAGKQAAYALYYSPLHFLTTMEVIRGLQLNGHAVEHILDLGCGGGAAGAAWATSMSPAAAVTGLDAHPWALAESAFTYRAFGLRADTRRGDISRVRIPRAVDAVVAGWVINELSEPARNALLRVLLEAASRRVQVLVVEPIATRVSPWWGEWATLFAKAGGRTNEWRFRMSLPDLPGRLDRAAGMRHDELTARSLWLGRQ